MKKFLLLLISVAVLSSCQDEQLAKRIEWTSSSAEAKELFEKFLTNIEQNYWAPEIQEALMDSILKLDNNFLIAKTYNNFGSNEQTRQNFLDAYDNREQLSDIEKRLIESEYEQRFGDFKERDKTLDELIKDYPDYYQLRIWSGQVKNRIDAKASQRRWEEALEINPKSFKAYVNLAFLHFPTSANFFMLEESERDLNKAEELLQKGAKIYPESSRWSRFLGNVYRAKGDFESALKEYTKSLEIIEKYETGNESDPYGNSLLMVGHVNTFQGKYEEARKSYQQAIDISNNYWQMSIGELSAHTYIYQKDFSNAVNKLNEVQTRIANFDEEELTKLFWTSQMEFIKFLAFGHSQNKEETTKSIGKIKELDSIILSIRTGNAINEDRVNRFQLNNKIGNMELDIWFDILFGEYEEARKLMPYYEILKSEQLEFNPNAMNNFYKYSGYLNLMEGNPNEAIADYNKLNKEVMDNDSYHSYFYALAKKAIGETEESTELLNRLANDNFATWQNAFVKNLAKAQVQS